VLDAIGDLEEQAGLAVGAAPALAGIGHACPRRPHRGATKDPLPGCAQG
jgi:hypothetical protein